MSTRSSSPFGSDAALRGMIAGHRRAAAADRGSARLPTAEQAFEAAMDLWSLCPELLDVPMDHVRLREVEETRQAWKKLRQALLR